MDSRTFAAAATLALAVASRVVAQGSLTGIVHRDAQRIPAGDALVRLPELNRETRADSTGRFRLAPLPVGTWIVTIQRPGLRPVRDSVAISDGFETKRTFVLDGLPQMLDSVVSIAEKPGLTAGMRQFEQRRATGFGKFLTPAELRKKDHRTLASLMAGFGGVRQYHYKGYTFLGSSRGNERGLPLAIPGDLKSPRACWATVFLDGARFYSIQDGRDAPDLHSFRVMELEAVEYYRGPAETPPELNMMGNRCGTIVIWTRQR